MSKTQYSLTDDASKLGAPTGFTVHVKDMYVSANPGTNPSPDLNPSSNLTLTRYVSAGAGFIVVSLGAISFIPGLPIKPAYYKIDLDLAVSPPRVVGLS